MKIVCKNDKIIIADLMLVCDNLIQAATDIRVEAWRAKNHNGSMTNSSFDKIKKLRNTISSSLSAIDTAITTTTS